MIHYCVSPKDFHTIFVKTFVEPEKCIIFATVFTGSTRGSDARVVEEARLESVYTSKAYRGFESPLLRWKAVAKNL